MRNLPHKATPINSRSLIPFLSQSIYHRILRNAVVRKTLSNIVRELNTKHGENEKSLRHCILHAESKILGAGVIVVFKIDYRRLRNADRVEIAMTGGEIRAVSAFRHRKTAHLDLRLRFDNPFKILLYDTVRHLGELLVQSDILHQL